MKLDARPAPYDATEHAQGAKVNASAFELAVRRELDSGELAGVVAVATRGTAPLYERAFGWRDLASQAPMTLDTVFMLASMTKTLTSVAALQLVEQGKVGLDQPLGGVVPELADLKVLEGFSAAGAPRLRPAKRSVTLRHLLTHTSGFRTRCMERGHRSLPGGDRTSTIERADQRVVATAAAIRSGRQVGYRPRMGRQGHRPSRQNLGRLSTRKCHGSVGHARHRIRNSRQTIAGVSPPFTGARQTEALRRSR